MKKTLYIYNYHGSDVREFGAHYLPDWNVTHNSSTPHIVYLFGDYGIGSILKARIKFGWKPLLCMHYGEPAPLKYGHLVDYSFLFAPTDSKNCCITLIPGKRRDLLASDKDHHVAIKSENSSSFSSNDNTKHSLSTRTKTDFCNFVYSREIGNDRKLRQDFCKLLMKYKKVDCGGATLNNTNRLRKYEERMARTEAKLNFISSYKFTIAFENASNDYYISEKIFHPLMVGSVPIYWGCLKIEEYINPNAIINCHNYNSFNEVIEKVKEIDNNPALYQEYINAKPVLPDSRFYQTERELRQRVQHIATEALERRRTVRINKWTGLWKLSSFIWQNRKALFTDYKKALLSRQNKMRRKLVLLVGNIKNRTKPHQPKRAI